MNKDKIQTIYDIYENDGIRGQLGEEIIDPMRNKSSGHLLTGIDSVRMRISKVACVCLVLLYFLQLNAVIVLCVLIYKNNPQEREKLTMITSHTKEKILLSTNITNLTEERDKLLTRNSDFTKERDELLTNITNLTEERDELLTRNTNLTEERNELLTNITSLTEVGNELLTRNTKLTEERYELTIKKINLMNERDQIKFKNENLTNARNQLNSTLQIVDGWTYYEFSFYHVSNDTGKNWTESRRDCQQRGADLTIINNRQEQEFVMNFTRGKECWIGLTDSEVEGRWKWVDGSNMTSGMWAFKEPNGGTHENCCDVFNKGKLVIRVD